MSKPLPAPENASPLVRKSRSFEILLERDHHHDMPLAYELPQAKITSASLASSLEAKSSSNPSANGRSSSQLPQLSERESIFATHYTSSDSAPTTPRIPPVFTGKNDSQQDVDVSLELQASVPSAAATTAVPTLLRRSTLFTAATSPQSPATHPQQLSRTSDSHIFDRRLRYQAASGSGLAERQYSLTGHDASLQNKIRSQLAYPLRMSATTARQDTLDVLASGGKDEHRKSSREASSRDRARQAPSKARAEPQIEATLASETSIPSSRSRKASHYLGLFKENSQDSKRIKDKSKESPDYPRASVDQDAILVEETGNEHSEAAVLFNHASGNDTVDHVYYASRDETEDKPKRPPYSRRTSSSIGKFKSRRASTYAEDGDLDSHEPLQLVYGNQESIEWRSGGGAVGTLPLRLLEEIRNHHKADPANVQSRIIADEGLQHITAASKVEAIEYKPNGDTNRILSHQLTRPGSATDDEGIDDEEEYESGKEHISSATYYPHQGPSTPPDEIDASLSQIKESKAARGDESSLIPQTISLDTLKREIVPETVQSAISLQSKGTIHSIREDFQKSQALSDLDDLRRSGSNAASTVSDTDYESWDESAASAAGEAEMVAMTPGDEHTPTATPDAQRSYVLQHSYTAPLGAVELQPYKHQVGGHTRVFSFSKQAICKQLNNRENEFYEVIERRHPELLRFLPK